MNVMTKEMVEKDLTGIWDWMALWPVIWRHMEDSFAAVKQDTRRVTPTMMLAMDGLTEEWTLAKMGAQ